MGDFEWSLVRNDMPDKGVMVLAVNMDKRLFLVRVTDQGWKRDNGEIRGDIIAWKYINRGNELDILLRGE